MYSDFIWAVGSLLGIGLLTGVGPYYVAYKTTLFIVGSKQLKPTAKCIIYALLETAISIGWWFAGVKLDQEEGWFWGLPVFAIAYMLWLFIGVTRFISNKTHPFSKESTIN